MFAFKEDTITTEIKGILSEEVSFFMKRDDLIHEHISGNKWRKLKYNIAEMDKLGYSELLTFGGAYSNHIAAVAFAGKLMDIKTIGVIRGERPIQYSSTLKKAEENGMELRFVSRESYKDKYSEEFIKSLRDIYPSAYILEEGGAGELGVKGCEEILDSLDYDYICCSAGTGTTAAGLLRSMKGKGKLLVFPALKGGGFLSGEINKYTSFTNFEILQDYHFGGYAKSTVELMTFMKGFENETGVLLDPVYTSKVMYGLKDLSDKGFFKKGERILAIHTGGLQGRTGFGL